MLSSRESPVIEQLVDIFTNPEETDFKQLAQNPGLKAKNAYQLLLNYSNQTEKTWGLPQVNLENILRAANTKGEQAFIQASNIPPGQTWAGKPAQNSKAMPSTPGNQQSAWQPITKLLDQGPGYKPVSPGLEMQAASLKNEQNTAQPAGNLINYSYPARPESFKHSQQRQVTVNLFTQMQGYKLPAQNNEKSLQTQTTAREIKSGQDNFLNQQNQQLSFRTFTPTIQFEGNPNNSLPQPVQMAARMASVIQQAVTDSRGTTTLRIKLKPEHLGEITVRLVYNQGNLQAHFIAASAHTRELLEQSMGQLRENLAQLNINLSDTSTSPGHDGNDGWTGQYQQNQYSQGQFRQGQFNTPDRQTPFKAPGQPAGEDMPAESPITTEAVNINHLV